MRTVRPFKEFIKENIVKKQRIDRARAEFLFKESENSHNNLLEKIDKITLKDSNANDFIKSCYDIIMELVRARMLLRGYNASGFGAHEAEVAYMRMLGFSENEVQFADQLRYFRNGMLYYGRILDAEYAKMVITFTKKCFDTLRKENTA
ncbi:MAG: hypothetical protein GXP63_05860 [DPANN group archaeon]|nr:hypothetical protein [DPANN group archaeon]